MLNLSLFCGADASFEILAAILNILIVNCSFIGNAIQCDFGYPVSVSQSPIGDKCYDNSIFAKVVIISYSF